MSAYLDQLYQQKLAQGMNPKQARQSLNQDLAEVNALYQTKLASGMSVGQAATSQAGDKALAQAIGIKTPTSFGNTYTIKDGQNINTAASALNTTPEALLAANPDVAKIQTGLVINTPVAHGLPTPQTSAPSTAGFNNPHPVRVTSPAASPIYTGTAGYSAAFNQARATDPTNINFNPQATQQSNPNSPFANSPGFNPYATPEQFYGAPTGGGAPTSLPPKKSLPSHQTESRYVEDLFARTESGYTPNQGELKYLLDTNRISASLYSATPAVNGGYTPAYARKKGRGGSGGGGGGGRGGGGGYKQSEPAFSAGTGFRGLVNWRI